MQKRQSANTSTTSSSTPDSAREGVDRSRLHPDVAKTFIPIDFDTITGDEIRRIFGDERVDRFIDEILKIGRERLAEGGTP